MNKKNVLNWTDCDDEMASAWTISDQENPHQPIRAFVFGSHLELSHRLHVRKAVQWSFGFNVVFCGYRLWTITSHIYYSQRNRTDFCRNKFFWGRQSRRYMTFHRHVFLKTSCVLESWLTCRTSIPTFFHSHLQWLSVPNQSKTNKPTLRPITSFDLRSLLCVLWWRTSFSFNGDLQSKNQWVFGYDYLSEMFNLSAQFYSRSIYVGK